MKTLLIGGVAALAMTGAAWAQQSPGARMGDTDGDGRISRAEFLAAQAQRFERGDQNRDGTVTGEEVRAAMAGRRGEMRGRMFERIDADGDGAISRAEFDAMAGAREGRRGGWGRDRGHLRGPGGALVELGADGVTRAEAEARATAVFERMDANDDGFLSREDRQARY
ncbi:EF-hand domain-containing protein, partial [Brevundimonas sp.]|uniref:EF-hand domain-containing protein n=1 Tax=Brevundimonas sp. TaxID=1871086 RepID=UPI0025E2C691